MTFVARFHAVVDGLARDVASKNASRLTCRAGCAGCCVDDLTVFEVEADLIREAHPELLAHGEPASEGGCAFLDADARCRIYAERPYVCRTQGLPLRWLEEDDEGIAELRDICPENLAGPPLEELPPDALWTLGPFEEKLAAHQSSLTNGSLPRVRLRDLFHKTPKDRKPKLPVLR